MKTRHLLLCWTLLCCTFAVDAQVQWFSPGGTSHILVSASAAGGEPDELFCAVAMANENLPYCPWCQQQLSLCQRVDAGPSFDGDFAATTRTENDSVTAQMRTTGTLTVQLLEDGARIRGAAETIYARSGNGNAVHRGIGRTQGELYFIVPEGRSLDLALRAGMTWAPGILSNRGAFQLIGRSERASGINLYFDTSPLSDAGMAATMRAATLEPGTYLLTFHAQNDMLMGSGRASIDLDLTFTPWTCKGLLADTDADGLPDEWETVGILLPNGNCVPREYVFDGDGDARLSIAETPDPFRRDVYVEVDWMPGQEYTMSAFSPVVYAFEHSPVTNPDPRDWLARPDGGRKGVTLHVQLGEEARGFASSRVCMAGQEWLRPYQEDPPTCADVPFAEVRAKYFMPAAYRAPQGPPRGRTHYWPTLDEIRQAREMVYRYALLAEEIDATPGHGGLAQVRSNDLAVAPGSVRFLTFLQLDPSAVLSEGSLAALLTNNAGSGLQNAAFQCSTYNKLSYAFMHELGHTLGLAHGGNNDLNNKPNYMSVMNYAYMSNFCGTVARLNYSDWTPPLVLLEGSLNEEHGLGGPLSEESAAYLKGKEVAFGQALTVDEFARRTQGVALPSVAPPWNSNCVARNPRIRPGGAFGPDRLPMPIANADGSIDWDQNCRIDRVFVKADINAGFDDAGEAPDAEAEQLAGWDDWGNLDFDFRDNAYYQGGLYRVPASR